MDKCDDSYYILAKYLPSLDFASLLHCLKIVPIPVLMRHLHKDYNLMRYTQNSTCFAFPSQSSDTDLQYTGIQADTATGVNSSQVRID